MADYQESVNIRRNKMNIRQSISLALLSCVLSVSVVGAGNAENVLEYPGVIANRTNKTVVVDAVATGLTTGEAAEFILINSKSGHDYEALAVTKALPSHIREALIFIGIQPGNAVKHYSAQFLPRGELVEVRIDLPPEENEDEQVDHDIGLGDLLFNNSTDSTLQTNDFLFTGSFYTRGPGEDGTEGLAADLYDPHSVIATFTLPPSLLTVPWLASQGEQYGNIVPNPEYSLSKGDPLKFIFRPSSNIRSEIDLTLHIKTTDKAEEKNLSYVLKNEKGESLNKASNLAGILSAFGKLTNEGKKPYVAVHFDPKMKVGNIVRISAFLHSIDNSKGITIKPPLTNQLYYQAFLPKPILYDRNQRVQQPPELHIEKKEGGDISAALKQADLIWDEDMSGKSEVRIETQEVEGPSDFASKLKALESTMPVLLVYTSENIILGEMMPYVEPVLESHPTVFVLIKER